MLERSIDLMAIAPTENMTYLLGFHTHPDERPCFLFLTAQSEAMLVPELNAADAQQRTDLPMETYADSDGPGAALQRVLEYLSVGGVKGLAIDDTMRADFAMLLLERFPNAAPVRASSVLTPLRMRKDAGELYVIRANAGTADEAMLAAFAAIESGASERTVARAVRDAFEGQGVTSVNFAIIGAGPNGAYPHHATGDRRMEIGDAVVIDIGARMDNYNSDITRMAVIGEPSDELKKVHGIVDQAVEAALAAAVPGARAREVDAAARGTIAAAGYGEAFVHRTGHGLGVTGHEPPYITSTNDEKLEAGMVFSIEPGIYLPGRFGIRLEEIVVLTDHGPEVLSALPRTWHRVRA
jgi:Xaa-Pro aminopeptidase